jgi:hypothetical protein
VRAEDVARNGFNLDIRHPASSGGVIIRTRHELKSQIEMATASLTHSSQFLIETIRASELQLPARKYDTLKRLEDLDISINPENRNPEREKRMLNFNM